MAKRMERAPTAEDSRPEQYDERGWGAGKPRDEADEPDESVTRRLRAWYSLRRRGWRKNPAGHGFLCPDASCLTAGDVHTRVHHDQYHEDIRRGFETTDELIDELRQEIKDRDESMAAQQRAINRLDNIIETHTILFGQLTARGVYGIVEQVLADQKHDSEPGTQTKE